ncbi:hypothetical protein OSSY52_17470 [Tepiditoga spiralis]|uniref:Uncharacterized protein n=1 Tax=Tepiditoga spiralis TaxID=2108365 RepID=A0A7G1G878_9BACT|nr:hypothetical protein [Tepiditoga spiralis]BBE31606.1 hypothetical protein OSSY52_17470 [Tepiditoga spiralis]
MSIQTILNILNSSDFKNHSINSNKRINIASHYLRNPKDLTERKMFYIYRILGKNAERKISRHLLHDFQFLIMHVLKKTSEGRFNDIQKFFKLNDEDIQMIKFLMFPDKFPPGGYIEGLKKYGVEFYNSKIILKKLKIKNFKEIYSLMTYVPLDETSPLIQKILDEILSINVLKTKKSYFLKVKDMFESLDEYSKKLIEIQLLNISYYHYRLITSKKVNGVLIDGSNVVRYKNKNSIDMITELLDSLYMQDTVFFPAIIVFDKNIEYILNQEGKDILKSLSDSKRILYESPADNLILYLASKSNYFIISNDKFRDNKMKVNKEKLIEIRRFFNE